MAVGTLAAPTLPDAERAAAALAEAGAGRVVLFGSVARGEATERSDIDLVAIFDDLDYGERWERRCELVRLAGEAAGHSVDVSVTDRAEWAMRTTRVRTSFEGRAARDGVVLVDRPSAVDVDWGKQMVMPDSDYEEALYRLGKARGAMGSLLYHLRVDPVERGDLDEEETSARRQTRLHRGCGEAHMAVELALKSLIHLEADPERPPRGHDIGKLCDKLAEPHRSALPALLEPLGADAITPWRIAAFYGDTEIPTELLADLARTACRAASYVVGRFPADTPGVEVVRWYVDSIEDYLNRYALDTGEPLGPGGGLPG